MKPDEARRQAGLKFGGCESVKDGCRDARGTRWIDNTLQDLRLTLRMLRRSPAFTIVVVLCLTLGIGADEHRIRKGLSSSATTRYRFEQCERTGTDGYLLPPRSKSEELAGRESRQVRHETLMKGRGIHPCGGREWLTLPEWTRRGALFLLGYDDFEIIGVVKDVKYQSVREASRGEFFVYNGQVENPDGYNDLVVRAQGDPKTLIGELRTATRAEDSNLGISPVMTLAEAVDRSLGQEKLLAKSAGFVGVLALLLASACQILGAGWSRSRDWFARCTCLRETCREPDLWNPRYGSADHRWLRGLVAYHRFWQPVSCRRAEPRYSIP